MNKCTLEQGLLGTLACGKPAADFPDPIFWYLECLREIYQICARLKKIKTSLKDFNKKVFYDVETQASQSRLYTENT